MTLALPSLNTASSTQASTRPAARGNDASNPAAGSFGEAMSRASQSAADAAVKPAEKATAKPDAKRSGESENDKDDPAQPTGTLGLVPIPLDSRSAALALRSGAAANAEPATGPAADALLNSSLPVEGAALLPGDAALPNASLQSDANDLPNTADLPDAAALAATTDAAQLLEPEQVVALAGLVNQERSPATSESRKVSVPSVATQNNEQAAAARAGLDAATNSLAAESGPDGSAAGKSDNKTTSGNKAAPAGGNDRQPALDALLASLSASALTEPARPEKAGAEANLPTPSLAMMGLTASGPSNVGGSAFAPGPAPAGAATALPQDVGTSDWGKALGKHMLHMGQAGQDTAVLQLNPPGLGPLKITLSMNEQQIQASFVSTHPQVRAAIEAALPQLRAAMADGGLSLGETSVGSESRQSADAGQGQERRPGQRSDPGGSARQLASSLGAVAAQRGGQSNGAAVDIYA